MVERREPVLDTLLDLLARAVKMNAKLKGIRTSRELIETVKVGADVRKRERKEVRVFAGENVGCEVRPCAGDLIKEVHHLLSDRARQLRRHHSTIGQDRVIGLELRTIQEREISPVHELVRAHIRKPRGTAVSNVADMYHLRSTPRHPAFHLPRTQSCFFRTAHYAPRAQV